MKQKIKFYIRKAFSLLLVLIMILSIFPVGTISVSAAKTPTVYSQLSDKAAFNYPGGSGSTYSSSGCGVYSIVNAVKYLTDKKIDPHSLGTFAIKCGARVNGGVRADVLCKKSASSVDFGNKYGYSVSESYYFGSSKRTMKCTIGGTRNGSEYPSDAEWDTLHNKLISHLSNGEVAVVYVIGHYMAIVDYNPTSGKFLMLDSAAYKAKRLTDNGGKYQWVTADQLNYNKAPKANSNYNNQGPYIQLHSYVIFLKNTSISYSLTTDSASNISNNSATIGATLNTTASVQKWGYYISENYSDISKIDGTINTTETHKDTDTVDYCLVNDWNSTPKSSKNCSVSVANVLGKDLKPGTTYYYYFVVKIGGKWYKSKIDSFTTNNITPYSTKFNVNNDNTLETGLNSPVTVSWNSAQYADSYILTLKNGEGTIVDTFSNIKGTSYAISGKYFNTPDSYSVTLKAVNTAGCTDAYGSVKINVHRNCIVTFVDDVSGKIIETQTVVYGESAATPVTPLQNGYSFNKWDKSFNNVKEDITVKALYTPNKYTVKFVDGMTGEIIGEPQKVNYNEAATAPNVSQNKNGYKFSGWDKTFEHITEDTTVTANYEWYNSDYGAELLILNAEKITRNDNDKSVVGYEVTANISSKNDNYSDGRIVVVLKSEKGVMLANSESSAVALNKGESKNVTVFVPFNDFAYSVSVYALNDYQNVGPIAEPKTMLIDNSGKWSGWIEYTDDSEIPVIGQNGISDVQIESRKADDVTMYRSRTRTTTTSYSTSLEGWTKTGDYSWIWQSNSNFDYVPVSEWHSGFDKSNSLYKEYNKTPISAYLTETEKLEINDTAPVKYIYWHWCRNENAGSINRGVKWTKESPYNTFHAFCTTTYKGYDNSANAINYKNTSACKDTYWWNSAKRAADSKPITVYRQNYTIYKKLFTYEQYSNWSAWTTTPLIQSGNTYVESKVFPGETTQYYKYLSDNITPFEPEILSENEEWQIVNINGKIDGKYAGKKATVFVYKYTQASDFTNEYISDPITVGENGEINISSVRLREPLTKLTGDYTIAVSVEGVSGSFVIGKLEAPKSTYTVRYYDYLGETVIYKETVNEGGTVTAPVAEELNIPDGYEFDGWDLSTVGVNANLDVHPMVKEKTFVVTFVDWQNQQVKMVENVKFNTSAEKLLSENYNAEAVEENGIVVSWDFSDCDVDECENYVITSNTVITTNLDKKINEINFISPESEAVVNGALQNRDDDGNLIDTSILECIKGSEIINSEEEKFDVRIDTPSEIEESDEYIFYGWRNVETGEYLTDTLVDDSGTYYPVYDFSESVVEPVASVESGEFTETCTVELSTETNNAVIFYTTDGSEPNTSATAIEYKEPIVLTKSCVLKFYAACVNMNDSAIVSELYAINASSDSAAYHIVSVISNIPQEEGFFYQTLQKENTKFNYSDLENIEGYTYDGLYEDEEMTVEFEADIERIDKTMTLYVKYTPKQYTVNFVDYDDTLLISCVTNYGETAEAPNLEREGYVFIGWNSDDWCYVTTDGTYKAKYVPVSEYATVSLSKSVLNLTVGNEINLKKYVSISPLNLSTTSVSWESDNCDVAVVDCNGLVTVVGNGMAVITVTIDSTGNCALCTINASKNEELQLVLNKNSFLDIDSQGYLRRIPDNNNSVGVLKYQFLNDDSCLLFTDVNGVILTDDSLIGTGSVISLMSENTPLDDITVIMTGDFNGDGKINSKDISMLMQLNLEKREADYYQMLAMDVNGDGYVNNRDTAMLAMYQAGKAELTTVIS